MKRTILHSLVGLALLVPVSGFAVEEVLETVTMQPGESKEVVVETNEKIKIGWDHTDDKTHNQCKNMCIELTNPATGTSFAQLFGGAMGIAPVDGKSTAVLKNIEAFAQTIKIYKEPIEKK